jgi:signal transduction histidine kinase
MRRKLFIIEYVLLLLLPALVIGVAAFRLLGHEQERLRLAATAALEERAQAVAQSIRLAMTNTEDGLLVTLAALPDAELAPALKEWRGQNPLIRNVFILDPVRGLVLPEPPSKGEPEAALSGYSDFIRRYGMLFASEDPWPERVSDAKPGAAATPATGSSSGAAKDIPGMFPDVQVRKWDLIRMKGATVQTVVTSPSVAHISASALKETVDRLAQQKTADYEPKVRNIRQPGSPLEAGWIPWTSDNTLSLLGWVQPGKTQPVRGVEIDMEVLLPKLAAVLPAEPPVGLEYVLADETRVLRHPRAAAVSHGWSVCRVPVGPALPHWEVVVRAAPGAGMSPDDGGAFLTLSLLLTGIFLAAILTGGALLVFEAHRSRLDARRKTSFVSNVSHELKTPLTSIRMYAELLGERRVRDEEKQRRYLGIIITESQRLTRLINNVLDFSRIEQNRKAYNITRMDAAQTVRDVLDRLAVRIQEAGMYVRTELPPEGLPFHTDHDVLEQVLINLVDNAMKYAAAGRELRVELCSTPGGARLRVLDRGPGIPPSAQEKVFEKFYRTDHALTGGKAGCGLGLTISRKMLRELGGDLTCGLRDGGGACFTANLKDGGREPEPAAATEQSQPQE